MADENLTTGRLEDQIGWYDRKSMSNQKNFKTFKTIEFILAGAIPVLAGLSAPNWITAIIGAIAVLIESAVQMNQYQHNWLVYRSTCEDLKHEKYLYGARAGVYSSAGDPLKLLSERVEGLISKEHAKWVSSREESDKSKKN